MALAPGTRLGAYEIIALIGAGGMGEVYRARDARLNRDVALKVLPELFATDPDRLARFKREAQLLASLNHPHIAAIYGFEESALAMELVEGPTLADRVAQGPIPLEEALPIARQIADALEAAHEQGVIHRDLKPANIKVRADGTVKVLDFGLAKAFEGNVATPDVSQSPTLSVAATHMGVILGTAAYMAPEQAKGKSVDKRADIWAFGCVLYEMVTGRPAFEGDDVSEILASVIKGSANLDLLPENTHPGIRRVVGRCLEKDVRKRFRDIGDVRYELEQILANPEESPRQAPASARPSATRLLPWIAAAVALTAIVVGAAVWTLVPIPPVDTRPTARFTYTLPQNQTFRNTGRPVVAVSPDGRYFAYNANGGLYLRSMDALNARVIPGTEGTLIGPFFSPDGQWVGFFADQQLRKIPVAGGTAVALAKTINPFGASWGPDNTIVFGQPEGVMRVSANGGTPELLVATEKGEQVHGPQLLPGGRWVLFSLTREASDTRWDAAEIVVQSLDSGERKVLWRGGSDARYVPTGHLIYALDDALFALPFDLERLEVSGGPVPLLDGLQRAVTPGTNTATAHYGVSDQGTLVHVVGISAQAQARTLVWVDRNGGEEAIPAPPRAYLYPRISPDGMQVALDVRDQDNDIWIWSLARRTLTRLTFDPGLDRYPVWTPDGRRIAFSSQRGGAPNLFWQAADGTGAAERLAESSRIQLPHSIAADGAWLVFEELGSSAGIGTPTSVDVTLLALAGERQAKPLIATMFQERNGDLSADGRWLAYDSNESGRIEVYVRPFPAVESGRWQVSTGGGSQPLWAPNSRELYFVDPEGRIVSVSVQSGPGFIAGNPQVVVKSSLVRNPPAITGRMYDVSRDGRRFLLIKTVEGTEQAAPPPQIVVVQNWFEELKRLAPTN
jgi:serine/threonine protein kinase/Tol biopolymer transport system component